LVRSGLFAARQDLYHLIPNGMCIFTQRGVRAQDLFFGRFLARVRWWVVYANMVVPSMSLFYLFPLCKLYVRWLRNASWYGSSRIGVVGTDGFVLTDKIDHPQHFNEQPTSLFLSC
jgi:hypothetical protein